MKIAYAFRRSVFYPHQGGDLPSKELRPRFLRKAREVGFEGIELGVGSYGLGGSLESAAKELRRELESAGVPCVAIRGGGGLSHPRTAAGSRQQWERAIQFASWIGAGVVNGTVTTPPTDPNAPGAGGWGESVSQGSSRTASIEDFERTAKGLREVAAIAADAGVKISIEIHQHSIADNSWSALHLLKTIDHPNVGLNPDLGNIYWAYDVPEETCEAAIAALAPHTNYWHCKSLCRVHVPELHRAIFLQVPLPDGEIDYRFAIAAMLEANFDGYLAIEGLRLGDQWHGDGKSVAYVKALVEELRNSR
jgi:sugar phosphate isomerase/epimerase